MSDTEHTAAPHASHNPGPGDASTLDAFLGANPRRRRRQIVTLMVLALVVVAAGIFLIRFLVGSDSSYYYTTVQRADLTPLVSERGILRGSGEVTLRAPFTGTVKQAPVLGHTQVKTGDVLAILDSAQIHNAIALDSADLDAAHSDLAAAKTAADETGVRLARFETVWRRSQGRVPSLNEMEAARSAAAQARDARASAQARVKAASLKLSADRTRLDEAVVRAPVDGVLMASNIRVGQYVSARDMLFTIATGTDHLHVDLTLPHTPTGPLQAGALARVRLESAPDTVHSARLDRILVSPPGETIQRIAQFTIDKPGQALRPGMPVTAEIELPVRKNVLVVPNAALHFAPGSPTRDTRPRIFLLSRHGDPRRVFVTVGGSDGAHTEVFSADIKPGDRVITGWRDSSTDREP